MVLNPAGRMVQAIWDELPVFYPGVDIDALVIMPNHIHGNILNHIDKGHNLIEVR